MKKQRFLAFAFLLILGGCQKNIVEKESLSETKRPPGLRSSHTDTWPGVFNPTEVLSLYFEMTPENWDIMRYDISNEILVPARFKANDEPWINIEVRRKSSRALPSEENPMKIGMKVSINRPVSSQRWHGLSQLSLENGSDVGPVAEGVAWNLYELASEAGGFGGNVHAGLAAWVRVYVDIGQGPQYLGVYISVEQRNKQFLRNRGMWQDGTTWLYEVDDINSYVLDEGEGTSPIYNALCFSPFRTVAKTGGKKPTDPVGDPNCPTPNDANLKGVLDGLIDMRAMLVQGAIDAYTGNGDALFSHSKNFKVVDFTLERGKRLHYPWDLDAVFGSSTDPIYGKAGGRNKITQNEYQRIILNHPIYRQEYNQAMLDLLNGPLHPDNLASHFDSWKAAVQQALDEDTYEGPLSHIGFDGLKSWAVSRDANVRMQVAANNNPRPR